MENVFVTLVVFAGIYQIIKIFTDFLLKRRIVKEGHIEKAGILDSTKDFEGDAYPTLKWGLVALFAGLGLITIAVMDKSGSMEWNYGSNSFLAFGIELIAISLGFLAYFIISRFVKK